ncbi:unnamed protein product [Darwinula stevensoni]|uniref:Reverse transcriptase n=1 Tax=Darwinula stevensoni TaxID=69355 RepID=A0A7R8XEB5_9CRUS|nr:unnamed protein product [Darwinula stevensoni]CAG0890452.1 unnamed protein product [Darwinula stevensoni]
MVGELLRASLPDNAERVDDTSRAKEGGLQIWQLEKWIPLLKERRRQRLTNSTHPIILSILRTSNQTLQIVKLPIIEGNTCRTLEDLYKYTSESLYKKLDGRGLRFSSAMPLNHNWKIDGNKIQTGKLYISSIKTHGNLLPTQARASRGRNETPMCGAGCNSRASSSHNVQACTRTHSMRIKRHDMVTKLFDERLKHMGYTTIIEPKIRTSAGLRNPDLVISDGLTSHVLDTQIVNDFDDPDTLHQNKKIYYSNDEIIKWVKEKTKTSLTSVSTITFNCRGCMSKTSAVDLKKLGLTNRDFTLATVKVLEYTYICWRKYNCSTMRRRTPPTNKSTTQTPAKNVPFKTAFSAQDDWGNYTKNTINTLDKTIRQSIRSWLKLPKDTPITFIHARAADGGLEIK